MYSTCIFCHATLGTNEAIEHFPIGRRLVFDSSKGRLWVVCRKCERWNLSPLEERWEAIEECEREFSNTRLRVSTDNIGLARVREGLELVRIGSPQRPEMAAWRYGDQFGRRRRKHLAIMGAGAAAGIGLIVLGPATGIIAGSSWGLFNAAQQLHAFYQARRARARISIPEFDAPVVIRQQQLNGVHIIPGDDGWGLRVPFKAPRPGSVPGNARRVKHSEGDYTIDVFQDDAVRVAGQLLPGINSSGAKRSEVNEAVEIIGRSGGTDRLFERYAASTMYMSSSGVTHLPAKDNLIAQLPREVRLAMEMAVHEDTERRALEGELAVLEEAWRQAEEIAAISDNLFVSDETKERLAALKNEAKT
jgi:hypothetical protein